MPDDTAEGKTHATRALIELRRRILGGELVGGTRLYEAALAGTLRISRTPVREALARLAEDGLLDRAKGGYVVRTFQHSDVADAIELRGVLEGTAARLAAERGADPERLDRMRAINATLDACLDDGSDIDLDGYAAANSDFHLELATLAGSALLARELERVCRLPFAAPSAFLPDKQQSATRRRSLHVAHAQHRAIVEAIAGREGTRAEHLAREHARLARDDMEYILRERRGPLSGVALVID